MKKEPPSSFGIMVEETLDGISYSWKDRESNSTKFKRIVGLLLGVCIACCLVFVVLRQLADGSKEASPYFLWIVFGVCIVIALSWLYFAYDTIKGPKPFVLTLSAGSIRYRMGMISQDRINKDFANVQSLNKAITMTRKYVKQSRDMEISKVEDLRLEGIGEEQRLCLDYEGDTCEIGQTLSAPEREWLHELLREHCGMS